MTYKPERVFREVLKGLSKRCLMNELNQIPIKPFRAELKRNTQIIDDETLHKWIDYFEELGYIKAVNFGVLELCNDVDRPYEFLSDKTEKNGD